jgi:hypothetical protein
MNWVEEADIKGKPGMCDQLKWKDQTIGWWNILMNQPIFMEP